MELHPTTGVQTIHFSFLFLMQSASQSDSELQETIGCRRLAVSRRSRRHCCPRRTRRHSAVATAAHICEMYLKFFLSDRDRAVDMFRARSESDETRRNLAKNWKPFQQPEHKRKRSFFLIRAPASNNSAMNEDLHPLNQAGWPFAACLHFSQVVNMNRTALELFGEQVCGRDCVLNGKINSDTAGR